MAVVTPTRALLGLAVVALGVSVGVSLRRANSDVAPQAAALAAPGSASHIEQLERMAADQPGDASAWRALGLGYFDAGRFDDAARAYEKAAGLAPGVAVVWSSLGEARVMASQHDPMPPPALEAFRKAVSLDPKDPRGRYFLAVTKDLGGDHKGAIADWLALLADTPAGAPWESDLRRTIEQVGRINRIEVASRVAAVRQPAPIEPAMPMAARGIPGPSADDLRAASAIPPSQQRAMAEGMVARLEAKLRDNPANVDGWVMLMRSRITLGQPDKASAALAAATSANPAQAARLRQEAQVLGVK